MADIIDFTEALVNFKSDAARGLAGFINSKNDGELEPAEIKNAKSIMKDELKFQEYIDLVTALDNDDHVTVSSILNKKGISINGMAESNLVDRDMLERHGFNYIGEFTDIKLRNKVSKFLDEEEIEYMDDGTGCLHMKFNDRNSAYKVESAIGRMVSKNNPNFMRDHKEMTNEINTKYKQENNIPVKESKMSKEQLDENLLGSIQRLQTLSGMSVVAVEVVDQIEEAKEKITEMPEDVLDAGPVDDMDDPMSDIEIDPMGDEGIPGEVGDDPILNPMDPVGDMMDMDSAMDGVDGAEGDMGDDMGDMGVSMDPMDDPTAEVDDFGMDDAMDGIADVGMDDTPAMDPVESMDMEVDVRTEIETALSDILTKAPDLKISDYKDVVHRAEEVISQIRAMGGQYLREGISKKAEKMTIREAAEKQSGFKKELFTANTK